jgi:hypothetical protein
MLAVSAQGIGTNRFRKLANPAGTITAASWAFMRRQGAVYLRYAIQEAPVGQSRSAPNGFNLPGHPGFLQKSHVLRVLNPFNAEVTNTAYYAQFVAGGTEPHFPPASSGLPFPVRRSIGLHGTKANPWFDRAFQMGSQEIEANMEQLAQDVIDGLMS